MFACSSLRVFLRGTKHVEKPPEILLGMSNPGRTPSSRMLPPGKCRLGRLPMSAAEETSG